MKRITCLGKTNDHADCAKNPLPDERFCRTHLHMQNYEMWMIDASTLCKGCKKMHYFHSDAKSKLCEICKSRDLSKYKKEVIKCAHVGCTFKKSNENEYCGKHQLQFFIKNTENNGKNVCFNHVRGCREQLEFSYEFSKCQKCLENDRAVDAQKRTNAMTSVEVEEGKKICTSCFRTKDINDFISGTKETKNCKQCRDMNAIQDAKRRHGKVAINVA